MTEHQGDLRIVDNVVQYFTGDAWVDFRVTSLYEKGRADMFDDVIKWLEWNLISASYVEIDNFHGYSIDIDDIVYDLKNDLRPQQND